MLLDCRGLCSNKILTGLYLVRATALKQCIEAAGSSYWIDPDHGQGKQ